MSGFKLLILQMRELRPMQVKRVAPRAVCLTRLVRKRLASCGLWPAEGVTWVPFKGGAAGGVRGWGEPWDRDQENLRDEAGVRAWKQEGDPGPLRTLTPALPAQLGGLDLPPRLSPPCDTS